MLPAACTWLLTADCHTWLWPNSRRRHACLVLQCAAEACGCVVLQVGKLLFGIWKHADMVKSMEQLWQERRTEVSTHWQ